MTTAAISKVSFLVTRDPEGGYQAEALAGALVAAGRSLASLRASATAVARQHFGPGAYVALLVGGRPRRARLVLGPALPARRAIVLAARPSQLADAVAGPCG